MRHQRNKKKGTDALSKEQLFGSEGVRGDRRRRAGEETRPLRDFGALMSRDLAKWRARTVDDDIANIGSEDGERKSNANAGACALGRVSLFSPFRDVAANSPSPIMPRIRRTLPSWALR